VSSNGLRVLIANDNYFALKGLVALLKSFFTIVDEVDNGLEALEMVKKKQKYFYDAIILDINMPIMGGIEASNKIHQYLKNEHFQSFLQLPDFNCKASS
jgi:osomolarity two-component system sensor histidine kinase NIK1